MGSFAGIRFEAPDPEPVQKQAAGPVESKPNAGGEKAPDGKDERYEALEREVGELRTSNRQLVDLVGRQTPAPRTEAAPVSDELDIDWGQDEDEAPVDEEIEDPAALVEDLSKLGPQALAKRGFVRKADVVKIVREESRKAARTAATQVVNHARTEVSRENVVIRDFPDLADPETELFKATAAHVRAAVRLDPAAGKNPVTLYLAAKAATAEIAAKAARVTRGGERNGARGDDFDPDEEQEDREPVLRERRPATDNDRRIAAQQGDRGRSGRSKVQGEEGDFVMTSEAKSIASQMGLSDDEYRTEATRARKAVAAVRGRR